MFARSKHDPRNLPAITPGKHGRMPVTAVRALQRAGIRIRLATGLLVVAGSVAPTVYADPSPAEAPAPSADELLARLREIKQLRTKDGRGLVVGRVQADVMDVVRWLEATLSRIEGITKIETPYSRDLPFRVLLGGTAGEPSRVVGHAGHPGRGIAPRLEITQYRQADQEQAERLVCRLIFTDYVAARASPDTAIDPPRWLWLGAAQSLYREQRGQSGEEVLSLWERGELLPVSEYLEGRQPAGTLTPDLCGAIFWWLTSLPASEGLMEAVFVRLAEKVPISSAWIAEQLPDIELGADVEQAWEEWVMARGRTVHEPGIPTPRARKELEAALLLYPGEFGIPLAYPVPPGSGFRWLINQRKEAWVSSFAATKSASLAVVAVGRGPEIQAVAQAHLESVERVAPELREIGSDEQGKGGVHGQSGNGFPHRRGAR